MARKLNLFFPEGHQAHAMHGHPERPERVEVIRRSLQQAGLWSEPDLLDPVELGTEFLATVHSSSYLAWLPDFCRRGEYIDGDTYTTPASWDAALRSAGGAVAISKKIWESEGDRGFAICRPPGHHAKHAIGMGFCLLNNIAIATQALLQPPSGQEAGEGDYLADRRKAHRLAIVDLDLHHGNGTQDIFWRRDDVLFISVHQSPLFPGTGWYDEIGAGPGEGYTVNIPMPPGTGDAGYEATMIEVILPLLSRYEPEMILVSYGFDPHWRDPLGYLMLSASTYGRLISQLADYVDLHCHGRIALFLEGGYDLEAASACSQAVMAALLGRDFNDPLGPSPRPEGKSWQSVVRQVKEIWHI